MEETSNRKIISDGSPSNLDELINKLGEITSKIRYELPYSATGVQRKRALARREKDALIQQVKERLHTVSKQEADRIKSRLYTEMAIYVE